MFTIMAHKVQDQDDFDSKLHEAGDKLVIVCISATECDKCDGIKDKLRKLSKQFRDCLFLEVDADETDVSDKLGIYDYPTFHFYQYSEQIKGQVVRGAGDDDLEQVRDTIRDLR